MATSLELMCNQANWSIKISINLHRSNVISPLIKTQRASQTLREGEDGGHVLPGCAQTLGCTGARQGVECTAAHALDELHVRIVGERCGLHLCHIVSTSVLNLPVTLTSRNIVVTYLNITRNFW